MPVLLIAEREFRTYVATWSFWLSLMLAPLAIGLATFYSGGHPIAISVQANSDELEHSAKLALQETARLEGKTIVFGQGGASLVLSQPAPHALEASFSDNFPLSPLGRTMVGHLIERDLARAQSAAATIAVRENSRAMAGAPDAAKLSRLATMAMLWLTLTGSLGMLLQAIARERANRALESLLASAQGWEVVAGKLAGVGAISLLILVVWLGSAAASLAFLPPQPGLVGAVLRDLAQPLNLLRDGLIYVCAFAFYGAATLVLGCVARDSASAQNLARPLFLVLVAAFFVALGALQNSGFPSWSVYVPPFTPFLLLVNSAKDVAVMSQAILLAVMIVAAAAMMLLAARFLSVAPRNYQIFKSSPPETQPLV